MQQRQRQLREQQQQQQQKQQQQQEQQQQQQRQQQLIPPGCFLAGLVCQCLVSHVGFGPFANALIRVVALVAT